MLTFYAQALSNRGRFWVAYFLLLIVGWFLFCGAALAHTEKHGQPAKEEPPITVSDTWKGKDKRDHLIGSLILGAGARSFITAQPVTAGAFCMVPGVIKEAYDARRGAPGAWSWKDIAADAIGCGIGVAGADLFLTRDGKRYTLGWNVKF